MYTVIMDSSVDTSSTESGTRARTRSAILDAAIALLPSNPSASLAYVAERARVGRTTLHRYFPERADLLTAVAATVVQRVDMAVDLAEPERGPFLPAIRRTADALLEHGPIMMFMYSDPQLLPDIERWEETTEDEGHVLERLFAREEALFRTGLTAKWAASVFWALLYTGWEYIDEGLFTRQQAIESIMTTFAGGVLDTTALNE
ncbi:hypothetical protein AUV02_04400 [Micrococcus sp. CH3]|nr:hypothetical protein AUV02_04400 [Micrococcus sp. CH3]